MPYHFHVVPADLPGFGLSEQPDPTSFTYSFAALADPLDSFTRATGHQEFGLYVFDYDAPVGPCLAMTRPTHVRWIVSQLIKKG